MDRAWIFGFISGFNVVFWPTDSPSEETDAGGILAWMDTYCRANPLDMMSTAGRELVRQLLDREKNTRHRH
jgi:hypothetical protein